VSELEERIAPITFTAKPAATHGPV